MHDDAEIRYLDLAGLRLSLALSPKRFEVLLFRVTARESQQVPSYRA